MSNETPPPSQAITKASDQKYCHACAAPIHVSASMCPKCGAHQQSSVPGNLGQSAPIPSSSFIDEKIPQRTTSDQQYCHAIAIPAYQDYTARSKAMSEEPEAASAPSSSISSHETTAAVTPSPYPLPQLAFDQADFIGSMKRAQMEPHWVAEFTTYLSRPAEFWTNCISSHAGIAQEFGGMKTTEARQHAEQSCQSLASQLHQCLNGTSLGNAILCLQEHINNMEANGE